MIAAIEKILVPILRAKGFKGKFPDFHRDKNGHTDLIFFQFHKYGGSFAVNISYQDKKQNNLPPYPGKDAPPEKLKAYYAAFQANYSDQESLRLGSTPIFPFLYAHKLLAIIIWLITLLLSPLWILALILFPSLSLRIPGDHWFQYKKRFFSRGNVFENTAKKVIPYLENQAEVWWSCNSNHSK